MTAADSSALLAFDARRPFTRSEARRAGITAKALGSRRFHKIFYDMYIAASVGITPDVRARAVLKISPPDSHISHHTAAELWGAVTPVTSNTHVTVLHPNGRCVRRGVMAHLGDRGQATTLLRGIPIATPEQSFIDLAAGGAELVDLVIVGDGLVKGGHTSRLSLVEAAAAWSGRGRRLALRAARLVRTGVDSAMETRLRLLIVLAGLPEPTVNLVLRGPEGEWRLRFDLCFPDYKLIVEYDGRQHAESSDQWNRDIYRREDLDRMSWRIVIVTSRGIYVEPERTLGRVRDALVDCGATGLRPRFNNEWRRHFSSSIG